MPTCPDCGTALEKRFHFIGDHKLPYWACPKCHDIDITLEAIDLDFGGKFKWVYSNGFYELIERDACEKE
jgi:ssDNA-binding Zn-finger/Zn-ribbon topoisomerase 1